MITFELKLSLADCITWGLTIAGFVIAIWQFNKQMNKDRENRIKENKTTWFLNVIVLPHLTMLHDFYNGLSDSVSKKKEDLDKYRLGSHADFIVKRGETQRDAKKEISVFFDFLNPLISSHSKSLSKEIQTVKNDLEDIVTNFLEEEHGELSLVSMKIGNNKQTLLQKLNSELSLDRVAIE